MEKCDVAIVGAGPYGLSAAAHLTRVKGLEMRLFGKPMSFWERHMPEGMFLRSPWDGSHLSDPENRFTLDAYRSLNGDRQLKDPIPLKNFVAYGHWFRRQAGLLPDGRSVIQVALAPEGYQLVLEDGKAILARRVVVASGIQPFAYRPKLFENLPVSSVSHTSEHTDFRRFQGKQVMVIGGGQSALESAALLAETGAQAEVLIRRSAIHWLGRHQLLQSMGVAWLLYGRGGIGQPGISLIVQRPNLFRRLPRRLQDLWGARAMRPAGAGWLKPRTQNVTFHLGRLVDSVRLQGERLRLQTDDGSEHIVDHVLLGTGYRVNVALCSFLAPALLRRVDLAEGYPRLDAGFETSSPGLHFLGAPAAWSFGPLMKFVAGTEFAARRLLQRVAGTARVQVASGETSGFPVQAAQV